MRNHLRISSGRACLLFILLLLVSGVAFGRQGSRLEGRVIDPESAGVAGARVSLVNGGGLVVRSATTSEDGSFAFDRVASGKYRIVVQAAGFAQAERIAAEVGGGPVAPVEVRLLVGGVSDQVIVSATRTETTTDDLSGSVSVVDGGDFLRGSHSLVSEPLRLTPGAAVVQTGGRGGITTIFVRGGESDFNKVLIDGVPVNSAGGLYDFAFLTPENLERVELVRGPRSSLWGSDAMTGVIHLVTRRGTSSVPEAEFSFEGGSFDFHRETGRLSGAAGRFDYSGSFGFQSTRGRFRNSDYRNRSASVNAGYQLFDDAALRLAARWNNNSLGVPGPTGVLFADPDQRQKHRDLSLAATFDWKTTPRWDQTLRFFYFEFDTHSFDPVAQDLTSPDTPALPPFSFGVDFAFDFREHQKRIGFQYQTVAVVNDSAVVTGGLDYEREAGVFIDEFNRVSPDRDNLGVYVQLQSGWRDRLFLAAGARLERNTASVPEDLRATLALLGSPAPSGDVGFGTSVNPRVAVSYLARRDREGPIGASRFRASFGTGIKEPSLTEAFSPNLFFVGNPALDPERAISYDAGVSQEFLNRRAGIGLTYFDNRFRDLIVFLFDPVTFGPIRLSDGRLTNFVNLERSSARGLEVEGTARPLVQLQVRAAYTFLRSRVEAGADPFNSEVGLPLLRRPRHSGSFEAAWVERRYSVSFSGSLVGQRRDADPVFFSRFDFEGRPIFNNGYAKLNVAGTVRLSSAVTLFARVENVLNREYEEVLGFPAYKLNFTSGVRLRFGGAR